MKRLTELCGLIIERALGELSSDIFTALANNGRATLQKLYLITGLGVNRLREGLATLLQYHIVLCDPGDDDDPSYFQVDWHAAYVLIRTEKIQVLVGERHGEAARHIVDDIFQVGLITVGDLAERYGLVPKPKNDGDVDNFEELKDNGIETNDEQTLNGRLGNGFHVPEDDIEMGGQKYADEEDESFEETEDTSIIPNESITTVRMLHETLIQLLEQGFLVKVGPRSYLPPADLQQLVHDTILSEQFPDGKISGPKKKDEFKSAINSLKRKWQGEDNFSVKRDVQWSQRAKRIKTAHSIEDSQQINGNLPNGGVSQDVVPNGTIPSESDLNCDVPNMNGSNGNAPNSSGPDDNASNGNRYDHDLAHSVVSNGTKTTSVDKPEGNGEEHAFPKLSNDMTIQVNYNKCILALRTQRLERMAKTYLGPVTGAVYGALLRALEDKESASRDVYKIDVVRPPKADEDEEDDEENEYGVDDVDVLLLSATDKEVLPYLEKSIDLASGIDNAEHLWKVHNGTSRPEDVPAVALDIAAELGIKSEPTPQNRETPEDPLKDEYKRLFLLDLHFKLLDEHPREFLIRSLANSKSCIDIKNLTRTLIQSDLDTIISAHHGRIAVRMVRILREKGMLEEEDISKMTLKRLPEVRQLLANLQGKGLVDTQEVPREATRQPNRSMYLWHFNEKRVLDMFLQHAYQGMTRMFQRLRFERKTRYKSVLNKLERADVKGREAQKLTKGEKSMLREWRDVEESMLVQISRMDDGVALFRDFSGLDTSLDT